MTNDKFKTRIFTLVVEKALNYIIHIKKYIMPQPLV